MRAQKVDRPRRPSNVFQQNPATEAARASRRCRAGARAATGLRPGLDICGERPEGGFYAIEPIFGLRGAWLPPEL